MKLLLDMDGCICNWLGGVCKVFNKDYEQILANWTLGSFGVDKELGISEDEMWDEINKNETFWEDLEPYPHTQELLSLLKSYGSIYICTAPSRNPACAAGKMKWLQKHLPEIGRDFVITPQKWLLAKHGTVLVDDTDKVVDEFFKHGGSIVRFPQRWNINYHLIDKQLEYVKNTLDYFKGFYK
jgi:5'(3')-deoxyribonucleotidase